MTFKAKLFRTLYPLAKVYWFLTRPKTSGAGCIIEHEGRILLVRNTYGDGSWSFPGGGIKRNESADTAAKREIREEVGIQLKEVEQLGSFLYPVHYRLDMVNVFLSHVNSEDMDIDHDEILEAKWVMAEEVANLKLSVVARKMFSLYKQ